MVAVLNAQRFGKTFAFYTLQAHILFQPHPYLTYSCYPILTSPRPHPGGNSSFCELGVSALSWLRYRRGVLYAVVRPVLVEYPYCYSVWISRWVHLVLLSCSQTAVWYVTDGPPLDAMFALTLPWSLCAHISLSKRGGATQQHIMS